MAHELNVWLGEACVGTLYLAGGRMNFKYDAQWLARPGAHAVSNILPLQNASFPDTIARAFFAGLLPEGHARLMLARQLQVSRQNDFALLDRIGGDCAGALTLLPSGQLPETSRRHVRWLDEKGLSAVLAQLPMRPMLAGEEGLRLSLAGAQDKLPVVFDGQRIGLPLGSQPSTHIIKPAIEAVEDSVANEHFCMSLARAMGWLVADTQIQEASGQKFLLVTRYDRAGPDWQQLTRLQQEDFCQALGIVPEMKYQNEGGPGFAACFDILRQAARPSAPSVLRLMDYAVFNALIGNHDAHAKNFSLLLSPRGWVLAPLYDALSTAIYPVLSSKMAMKIGSRYKFTELELRHWQAFIAGAGFSWALARKRILEIARTLPGRARELATTAPHAGNTVVGRIVELIEQRAVLTQNRLAQHARTV